MSRRSACAPPLLALLVVTVGCFQSAHPPAVATPPEPVSVIVAGADESSKAEHVALAPHDADADRPLGSSAPFGVVFGGPRGETSDPSEVTVVFNRPMRPLSLAGGEKDAPVSITTANGAVAPKGAWRWIGTTAIVFSPSVPLARATVYAVTVPAGTRALDGAALEAPYQFEFATPAPKLVRLDPPADDVNLRPKATFDLSFNQEIALSEVERAVTLAADDERRPVAFRASHPKKGNGALVRLTPSSPLPLATRINLTVAASLRGVEGPRPLGEATSASFLTYGPLVVSPVDCSTHTPSGKCDSQSYFRVGFSNPVPLASWRAHVRIERAKGGLLPLQWSESGDYATEYGSLEAPFAPAESYSVVVSAGLRDELGQVLGKEVRLPIETGDFFPSAKIAGIRGSVFEAPAEGHGGRVREVPIATVNLESYDLLTGSLTASQVAELTQRPQAWRSSPGEELRRDWAMPGTTSTHVVSHAPPNVRTVRMVKLDDVLAHSGGRGAVLVGVRAAEPYDAEGDMRLVSVSDLAISARMSRFGSLVWVTRLSDGSPVKGASVAIHDAAEILASTTTDADGFATFTPAQYMPSGDGSEGDPGRIVVAAVGNDWTWRDAGDTVGFGGYGDDEASGALFTERGIYRPGETIRLKGVFREATPRGASTPRGKDVSVTVSDGLGGTLFDGSAALDAFGAFALDVPIAPDAHLGLVEIEAQLAGKGGTASGTARATARIASYRPAEFKVAVDAGAPSYVRGARATFAARGDYLFGSPMGSGHVRFTISRNGTTFTPPGTEDLVTSDEAYRRELPYDGPRASEIASGEGTLDAHGSFARTQSLALPNQHEPEMVTFEAEITDVSRQAIAGRSGVLVHPAELYAALEPPKELFVPKGRAIEVGALAVKPSGERVAGVALSFQLVKRTWRVTWGASGEDAHAWPSVVDETAASCDVATGVAPVSCALTPATAGYFLVRASGRDARGNEFHSSTPVYVLGDGEVGWRFGDGADLELVADKAVYEPGDVARVLVKNPFPEADALVTVERAGIYSKQRVHLAGSMPTLSIPITSDLRPNAFVSVHLIRGRTKDAPPRGADVGAPTYRAGTLSLVVNPESRRLHVEISPAKKDLRPGDSVDADVLVRDRAGVPTKAEVTFYAVDEGVLSLTGYTTPDLLSAFTETRPDHMFVLETRADLAKVTAHAGRVGVDKGDEGGGGGAVRSDFRSTAFFEPSLPTNKDGRAHVHFKLPDGLTTYRLIAVAIADDDRFGSGESHVTVSRRLMARPNLPRFLRAGDAVEAGVIVTTKGLAARAVSVAIEASGIEVAGATKKTVVVPASGSIEVRWSIRATTPGKAHLAFRASAGADQDAVAVDRDVEVPLSLEAVALYGETTGKAAEQLGDLSAMRSDVGGLDVRLTSSALVGLDDGVEQLLEYPYGCTEQLSSRLVPMVALRPLARDYGIALPPGIDGVVAETVAKIEKNQRGDGGFGWWVDSRESDPWLSAYAAWTLTLAKGGGAPVRQDVLDAAQSYLRAVLPGLVEGRDGAATAAFILDVLTMLGRPDYGYMGRLYADRDKLAIVPRALLAHAMARASSPPNVAKELVRDMENHLRVTGAGATVAENVGAADTALFDSDAWTTAIVLRALLAVDPKHPLAARLAKGLLAARRNGTWRTTNETSWALLALDDYRRAQEATSPDFDARVLVGDVTVDSAAFHGRSLGSSTTNIPSASLLEKGSGVGLGFDVEGTGKLFYEARLRYARRDLPTDSLDRGMYVKRVVRVLKPGMLEASGTALPDAGTSSVAAGDLVLVDLVVVTPDPREQVVLDDPLPAGLEPVETSLATTAQSLRVAGAGEDGDASEDDGAADDDSATRRAWQEAWFHREFRDDRVLTFIDHMAVGAYHYRYLARATTIGTFVVPPTRVECMYEPETFGRTAGGTFVVRAK